MTVSSERQSNSELVDQLRRLVDEQEGGDAVVLVQRQLFNRVVGRLAETLRRSSSRGEVRREELRSILVAHGEFGSSTAAHLRNVEKCVDEILSSIEQEQAEPEDVAGEQVMNVAHRIQSILADTLQIEDGEIIMTGPASYKIARLFKPAPTPTPPEIDEASLLTLQQERDRLREDERARWEPAIRYFDRYCQDEADDVENCVCGSQQHEDAKAFASAIHAARAALEQKP